MQLPPDISTDLYAALGDKVLPLSVLLELYDPNELPGTNGFDPNNAILRVSNTHILDFLGNEYTRYITSINQVNKNIGPSFNNFSITLDNRDRTMAAFVINNEIEGMIAVVRVIARSVTAATLADSLVVFTGKCDAVFDATNTDIVINAKQYLGTVDQDIPWRTFTPDDELGTASTDVAFEGFLFSASPHSITFKERVRRGGFLGLLGFKKTVTRTLQYTSHQGVEIEKAVPLILGRAQAQFIPVAYIDVGLQINTIFNVSEGPIKKFYDLRVTTAGFELASAHDHNPAVDQFRYGYLGNTNGQVPFVNNLTGGIPGNGYYSHSAMLSTAFYGTDVSTDDPAPDLIGVFLGMLVDLPDTLGDFTLSDWSDNPAFLTRWALTHPRVFNLDPAFIEDPQCIETACYCDEPVLDETNGELIVLPNSETSNYGTLYRRYHSTGLFTPQYFKHYFLNIGQDPLPELTLPLAADGMVVFYDPTGGVPTLATLSLVRKRYTANIYLAEKMKAIDFLFKVLLPTYRGYITQNARGRLAIKAKRPADNTIIRSTVTAGDTTIAVNNIAPWVASLAGKVIVGNEQLTSEVREVVSTSYTTVANSITLAVSGNLTASGGNLTGGTTSTPATGSVTVTGLGTLTVTIDGRSVSYTTITADTIDTAAALLCQFLKADTTFKSYLKFSWDKNTPDLISIESRIGFLTLASPLAENHSIAEEVLRIQMAFSDKLFTPSDLLGSNILRGSMKWPVSSKFSSINRIDGSFSDSPRDFVTQPVRTRDGDHIARTRRTNPEEMTLTGVDNYFQAKSLELSLLAERRDLNFFMQHTSDRLALLIEEGDVICNTHASGGFRNVALRVEEIQMDLQHFTVNLLARRYSTTANEPNPPARNVPLPTVLGSTAPPDIAFDTAAYPASGIVQTTNSTGLTTIQGGVVFGASAYGQEAKISVQGPGDATFTLITTVRPDANNRAQFEFPISGEGDWTVQAQVCFTDGSKACNSNVITSSLTSALGVLNALIFEDSTVANTEAADFLSLQFD